MSTVWQVTGVACAVVVIAAAGGSAPATGAGRVAPPLPGVHVHRVGDHLIVRYGFRSWPRDPRRHPATLLVSSQSAGTRYPPLTTSYSTRGIRSATRSMPVR